MSRTILWTSICWGYKSHLKDLALNRNVVAFAGCDNQSVNRIPEYPFAAFLKELYSGNTVLNAAMKSIPLEMYNGNYIPEFSTKWRNPITSKYYNIKDKDNNITVGGNFSLFCQNTEITGKVLNVAMSAIDNRPRASLTLPYDWYNSANASRNHSATRATSKSGVSYGFWLKKKGTRKVTEIEFDQHTESTYLRYDYENMISRLELLGDTKNLEPGTYEYRTFLEIDGEKTYSDETFEFKKEVVLCPDDNHPHMIDLGLPSGTLWSCCNEGASKPEEYGSYCSFNDVPSAPSKEQFAELRKLNFDYTSYHGVVGGIIYGNNGNAIFLPCAGYKGNGNLNFVDEEGFYWSSTPYDRLGLNGYFMHIFTWAGNITYDNATSGKNLYSVRSVR